MSRRGSDAPVPGPALARALLRWFGKAKRPLPWRIARDPYRIWIAEVLLQQTRVAQATPYFERFVRRFPNAKSLARASVQEVLRTWQGAGYYARARHLHSAARRIVRDHGGRMPATLDELEALPGVGRYTARAIASIAFGAPVIALDANGVRVAARWWADRGDVRSERGRRRLEAALWRLVDGRPAGVLNEAIMELGETICLPRLPRCEACPVRAYCRAFLTLRDPGTIPSIRRARPRPHVRAALVVVEDRGRFLVQRRPATGLLGGLYEFPGGKIEPKETPLRAARRELEEEVGVALKNPEFRGVVRHAYSHFTVELHVFASVLPRRGSVRLAGTQRWATRSQLRRLPLPKATEKVLALLDRTTSRATPRRSRRSSAPQEVRFQSPRPPG